jgi:hypothetical protein
MKKIKLIAALLVFTVAANAQQSVVFKMKFLPNRTYNSTVKMGMKMEMSQIPAKGKKSPKQVANTQMKTATDATITYDIKTGASKSTGAIPVTFKYVDMTSKSTMNGKEIAAPKNPMIGKQLFGEYSAEGKMHIDSVEGAGKNDQLKQMLTQVVNKMQTQIKFPEKALKIGETFNQDIPFAMPAAGMDMQMMVKMSYKLKAIKNNLAYFDIVQTLNFNMNKTGTKMVVNGTGSGAGKMVYNISQNYPEVYDSNLDMKYNMMMGTATMASKIAIISEIKNQIKAN